MRATGRHQRRHGGFSLLEVLISASMLVAGLAGVVSFAGQASAAAGHQRHITIAAHVAEIQMEKLVLLFPDDARLGNGAHTGPRYDDVGNPSATGSYATSWQVAVASPIAGARTVTVTVSWNEGPSARTTLLKTIRT